MTRSLSAHCPARSAGADIGDVGEHAGAADQGGAQDDTGAAHRACAPRTPGAADVRAPRRRDAPYQATVVGAAGMSSGADESRPAGTECSSFSAVSGGGIPGEPLA